MTAATQSDLSWVLDLDADDLRLLLASLTPLEQESLLESIERLRPPRPDWAPMPHQIPPSNDERWLGWLLLAGRFAGKTAAITRWLNDHMNGPPCFYGREPHRCGIIAPTLGDASASIVHGVDGLMAINPAVREITQKGGTIVRWPNGAFAFEFGVHTADDVERLRAKGNRCADVYEELAAWRYLREGMIQAELGRRSEHGLNRWVGATTPKPRPTIRKLLKDPNVRLVTASSTDNWHMPQELRDHLQEEYGGTRLGLQELEARVLDDVAGALWSAELIEQFRVREDEVPELRQVRTYVDPSWGTTNDECGIIVAGRGVDNHVYVLGDLSKRCPPSEWGLLAALGRLPPSCVTCKGVGTVDHARRQRCPQCDGSGWGMQPADIEAREWFGRRSEKVVYEKNFQGEQVRSVMKLVSRDTARRVLTAPVTVTVGKRLRADPVLWAYERGRVHHVGDLKGLEFQLTTWVPPGVGSETGDPGDLPPAPDVDDGRPDPSKWSPDRLDALCMAVSDLALSGSGLRWHGDRQTMRQGPTEIMDGRTTAPQPASNRPRSKIPEVPIVPFRRRQNDR